ncbi:hypothetical protein ACWGJT_23980 [Streptomyces xantholiticus]
MATARLAPGVALVTVPGHGLAVRTPDGEFLRVDTGTADREALVAHLTHGGGEDAELARLRAAFDDAGFLSRTDDTRTPLAGRTVVLLGAAVLTEPLARFVRAEGGDVRHTEPDRLGGGDPSTAVVWCLDSPVPAGLWDKADELPAHGTAWLRCHREGTTVWIEPLAAARGDVTSADVRLRRLAATPAHRELAAYWAGSRTDDTGPAHTAASAALTAALLTADLIAWATGRTAARRLRRLDLRDLDVTEHPVLPVPAVAPLSDR